MFTTLELVVDFRPNPNQIPTADAAMPMGYAVLFPVLGR